MQIFKEGKDGGWGHINYKVEYETKRDGSRLGIKYKMSWSIDKSYYFGFNIMADIWTEGKYYFKEIKKSSPNTRKW